jgi:hypothetical protein
MAVAAAADPDRVQDARLVDRDVVQLGSDLTDRPRGIEGVAGPAVLHEELAPALLARAERLLGRTGFRRAAL